jgi:hypothetical protein
VHHERISRPRFPVEAGSANFNGTPVEKEREFLASPDEWFRPVDLAHGPDGALYVVDMYRAVIEHPEWVPEELKNRPDAWLGNDRGRIYRIMAETGGNVSRLSPLQLSRTPAAELIPLLKNSNGWHRDTAARLLNDRQDKSIVAELANAVRADASMRARGLWCLEGLNSLSESNG